MSRGSSQAFFENTKTSRKSRRDKLSALGAPFDMAGVRSMGRLRREGLLGLKDPWALSGFADLRERVPEGTVHFGARPMGKAYLPGSSETKWCQYGIYGICQEADGYSRS
jgi:hypothetical protein